MRGSFATALAAATLLYLSGAAAQADTIVRKRSNQEGVTVFQETFKKVYYWLPGSKIKQEFDVIADGVIRVDYENWPEEWEIAKIDLSESRFEDAAAGFEEVSRANSEDFPQAKQYGLYMMAETYVKWAESGEGKAVASAIETFDKLLAAEPETVHLAKVFIGRGKCLLMTGKKDPAMAEFSKVVGEQYFRPGDKVMARVQMALVSEMEEKFAKALEEYTQILGEATKEAPEAAPMVKVRMAACKVGLGKFGEAAGDFDRILSTATTPAVKAAAYNGRGECSWKNKDYEKALWDFLRVVVLFESVTTESPKAFYYAAQCMKNIAAQLRKENKKDEEKAWRGRSKELETELKEKFPGSPWSNK